MYSDVDAPWHLVHHHSRKFSTSTRTATAIRSTPISTPTIWNSSSPAMKSAQEEFGKPVSARPARAIYGALSARCSASWMNQRAITYRRLHAIPESWGTAVNVQCHGLFGIWARRRPPASRSRANPSTGEKKLYGEFLINAQGEDVVAGIRHAAGDHRSARKEAHSDKPSNGSVAAGCLRRAANASTPNSNGITATCRISNSPSSRASCGCWQTPERQAHGTGRAAPSRRTGAGRNDHEGEEAAAAGRSCGGSSNSCTRSIRIRRATRKIIATGLRPSPGAACGEIVFSSEDAETLKTQGRKVIWCVSRHRPLDIHGMHAAEEILTTRGGMTSHAAGGRARHGQALRLSGAGSLRVDYKAQTMDGGRHDAEERRDPDHRRFDRPGAGRQGADAGAGAPPASSPPVMKWGGWGAQT